MKSKLLVLLLSFILGFNGFSQEEYLSDRGWFSEWNSVSEVGRRKAQLDRNFDGGPLTLWGVPYNKGIGMHSTGNVIFSLLGEYKWFMAYIGIDDAANKKGSCRFYVYGDGELLYQSKLFKGGSDMEEIRLPIEDVQMLELKVDDGEDGVENDLADWINARVIPSEKTIDWKWLGDYHGYHQTANRVYLEYTGQQVFIEPCTANIVRVKHSVSPDIEVSCENSSSIRQTFPGVDYSLEESNDYISIATDSLLLKIQKQPFSIDFIDKNSGDLLASHTKENSFGTSNELSTTRLKIDASGKKEFFYDGSLRYERFNLRGATIRNWATYVNRPRITGEVEVTIPLTISTNGYAILLNNSYESRFMYGSKDPNLFEFTTYGGDMDYYFISGTFKQIIKDYYFLAGRSNMPLLKSLGMNFRGKGTRKELPEGYRWDDKQFIETADEFRQRSIPFDVIATEPGWSTFYFGNFTWSDEVFPDPQKWCSEMKDRGLLTNNWVFGHVVQADTMFYEIMKPYVSEAGYPDVFNQKAMDLYFEYLNKTHFDVGLSGFKEDSHADRILRDMVFPTGKTGEELHNSYWSFYLKAIYDRYRDTYGKRYYSQTATGYIGTHRYCPAIYADYLDNLAGVTRAMASTGWSGIYYCPEIMGYYIPDDNHYMRMTQIAAFSPIMIHNEWQGGELPWKRPEHVFENYMKYVRLHYRFIPYLYSHAWEQHSKGISVIRSLPLEFQNDTVTYTIGTQYMYGQYLMVAPVWDAEQNFEKRDVYFPQGCTWYDYETDEQIQGGKWLRDQTFPLNKLPLYVREGAILPQMEVPDYIGQKPLEKIILDIYPSKKSSFTLYEDDGITFQYEEGKYALTEIKCTSDKESVEVIISSRRGNYDGMPEKREYEIHLHLSGKVPERLTINKKKHEFYYENGTLSFTTKEIKNQSLNISLIYQ